MHAKLLFINYEVRRDLGNKYMKYDYNSILKFILKMYLLNINSSRYKGTKIVLILDRTRFILHIAYIMYRVKVFNIRVRYLKRRNLLMNFQSYEYSFMFEMHLMKDTKDGYKYLKEFFKWKRD